MIRLMVDDPLEDGARIALDADRAHYLLNVMRRGAGDGVLLFNGRNGEWTARIAEATRRTCLLETGSCVRSQPPAGALELAIALVKRPRLELIVEKATELGVCAIRLVKTERTNAERANLGRLRLIAREAAEQCGRLDVPDLFEPVTLEALVHTWPEGRALAFCDEVGGGSIATLARSGPATLLIGPEGGFSADERTKLSERPFTLRCALGPRILRAETAAIAALSVWQACAGDWRTDPPA